MLCSDGISDYLTDTQIAAILRQQPSRRAAGQALIDAALNHNSNDNLTAIIADVVPQIQPLDGWLPYLSSSS